MFLFTLYELKQTVLRSIHLENFKITFSRKNKLASERKEQINFLNKKYRCKQYSFHIK